MILIQPSKRQKTLVKHTMGIGKYIDLPIHYAMQYGSKQIGSFIHIVQPVCKKPHLGFPNSAFNLACRIDEVSQLYLLLIGGQLPQLFFASITVFKNDGIY